MTGFTVLSIFFTVLWFLIAPPMASRDRRRVRKYAKLEKNALLNIDQKTYILFKGVLNPGSGGFSFSLIPPLVLSKNAIALLKRAQI